MADCPRQNVTTPAPSSTQKLPVGKRAQSFPHEHRIIDCVRSTAENEHAQMQCGAAPPLETISTHVASLMHTLDSTEYRPTFSLADFTIMRTVGTGSYGRVHLVQHKQSGNFFALKVLRKAQIVKTSQVEHIKNERFILLHVDHPFIVKIYATTQDKHNLYILMEFLVGGELFSILRRARVSRSTICVCAFNFIGNFRFYRCLPPNSTL